MVAALLRCVCGGVQIRYGGWGCACASGVGLGTLMA